MFEDTIQRIILTAPPILFALTVHECAHAWVADRMGDPTARMLGRVTLNPLKHLDPIGTLALFFSGMFGWARPVPINPRNFRDSSKGMMLVALAGPASNLMLAAASAMVYKLLNAGVFDFMASMPGVFKPFYIMVQLSIIMNVSLAIFNMVPIPPLDGSRVFAHFLSPNRAFAYSRIEPYGFLILIVLIYTGIINRVVSPLVFLAAGLLTGGGL